MEEADLELSPRMNRGMESGVPPTALRDSRFDWSRRFTQQINDNKLGTDMKELKW